jgi:hypothetical protein
MMKKEKARQLSRRAPYASVLVPDLMFSWSLRLFVY